VIEQGVLPHCISTDLTVPGRVMTVHSMTEMMTRFLGLGFTLPQVVTMCTANPSKAAGLGPAVVGLGARPGAARGRADPRRLLLSGQGSAKRSAKRSE
jgi:predicted amidohydrolase